MPPVEITQLRELFTKLGYDVSGYTNAEVSGAIRPVLPDRRTAFSTKDVRAAFGALLTLRQSSE